MCFDFLYNTCLKHFLLSKELSELRLQMYIGLRVKCLLYMSDFKEIEDLRQIIEKYSHIKFYENPSSGSRFAPCGRTDGRTHGQTDMMKPIDAFRNFINGSKNWVIFGKVKISGCREKCLDIALPIGQKARFLGAKFGGT